MRTPTWYVAFQAAVRAESKTMHDTCAAIANEVVGDAYRRALDELELKDAALDAALERAAEVEHDLAVLRAATAYRGNPVELKLDDEGNFVPSESTQ
jgi:hypothetical protein